MPVFYALIILGLVLFWVLATGSFKPIGRLLSRFFRDVADTFKFEEEH